MARGSAAGEGFEDGAAGWGDEPYEPAHQGDGLHGRMSVSAGCLLPQVRTVAYSLPSVVPVAFLESF